MLALRLGGGLYLSRRGTMGRDSHAAFGAWSLGRHSFGILALGAVVASAQLLPPGTTPTKLVTGYVFTEGALYDQSGGVYFEDMHPSGLVAPRDLF
jgi:hypothetical protein